MCNCVTCGVVNRWTVLGENELNTEGRGSRSETIEVTVKGKHTHQSLGQSILTPLTLRLQGVCRWDVDNVGGESGEGTVEQSETTALASERSQSNSSKRKSTNSEGEEMKLSINP